MPGILVWRITTAFTVTVTDEEKLPPEVFPGVPVKFEGEKIKQTLGAL